MIWPWVARSTLEEVRAERDRLREQNDQLHEQLIRLARVRNGRPETIPEKKKQDREPVPDGIREMIEGFQSKTTQLQLYRQCRQARAQGREWNEIKADLEGQLRQGMMN